MESTVREEVSTEMRLLLTEMANNYDVRNSITSNRPDAILGSQE